jgi:acyl-CoA dehydrogenase
VDFSRTELELELETRVQRFIAETVVPREPKAGALGSEPTDELRRELQALARDAGLLAPQLSREFGGYGLSFRQTATVLRAAGYSLLGPLALNVAAPDEGNMHLLEKIANPTQLERYLRPLAAGEIRSCFLMTEPDGGAGSDPRMLRTSARRVGDEWIIEGRKWLITGAVGAAFGIVMARTDHGATMFLIDMADPAVRLERVLETLDSSMVGGHAVVMLDGVHVSSDQVLGAVDEGFRYAQVRLAPARLTHCMRWWGAARRAHDTAARYAARREAFGKALIEHEGVGFMLADNLLDLQRCLLIIDHTAWVLDQGSPAISESSMAKIACSEALFAVADRSLQILGGAGITRDHPVEQIFREIRAFRIYDGPSEVHRWSLAGRLLRELRDG